ncbi:phosphoribosyl-AMP cyclohydrolase [Alteriqipengyuania flavescens]|uniref:phosphoribosyl-AMP cyclohydrolase n=1 Tax=Alteriqipengyuania flavescens TaxID=3053610 RepID=UPI0025B3831D|nr:phosphoribosyl-AMP cyclohydrolase [Alteriqipengyuania flavescens]WJY18290.1 phosphoribosyl-AMP cyclohydrolase [Alteriqipengyuania flavescens]WJY24231.1 phosphoribosyl-AMP cyclohydrolase [Alteriqipengyuania flavescens]
MTTDSDDREQGSKFMPKFGADGLVTAIVQAAGSGEILMVAHMNADAIAATRESGMATFWSRSRQELWCKGETSGNTMKVREMRVDCDQDALLLIVEPAGPACHTGSTSCFYRRLEDGALRKVRS